MKLTIKNYLIHLRDLKTQKLHGIASFLSKSVFDSMGKSLKLVALAQHQELLCAICSNSEDSPPCFVLDRIGDNFTDEWLVICGWKIWITTVPQFLYLVRRWHVTRIPPKCIPRGLGPTSCLKNRAEKWFINKNIKQKQTNTALRIFSWGPRDKRSRTRFKLLFRHNLVEKVYVQAVRRWVQTADNARRPRKEAIKLDNLGCLH